MPILIAAIDFAAPATRSRFIPLVIPGTCRARILVLKSSLFEQQIFPIGIAVRRLDFSDSVLFLAWLPRNLIFRYDCTASICYCAQNCLQCISGRDLELPVQKT
jgi:hypothetical protein